MSLTMREAFVEAAENAGADVETADVAMGPGRAGWRVLDVADIGQDQLIRRVAFPTPDRGVRQAYEAVYSDGVEESYRYVVDAETGDVLLRQAVVDHATDDPTWEIFPATPPLTPMGRPPWNYSSADTRQLWCWTFLPGCRLAVENDAARVPWDVDAQTGVPTFTTIGNAVDAAEWWNTVPPASPGHRPTSADREYRYPWTNAWYETRCHSGNLGPGFGENASVEGTQDTNPVPSFASPMHEEATLRFEAVAKDEGGQPVDAQVFGGNYEARTTALQSAPNPRPSSPDLLLRSFQIPPTTATHVKFVVGANQCTGNPNYQGDQHDDPASPTSDCRSITIGADQVRAAELQLLTSTPRIDGAILSE